MVSDLGTRVLITGGAIGDIPLIKQAISMGFEVYTSGNRPNDPGHRLSAKYIASNYTDADAIENIVVTLGISYLVPSCHDTAYIAAATVAKKRNLPGFDEPDIARMIHSKDRLARAIRDCGLVGIDTHLIEELEEAKCYFKKFGCGAVIKPPDMTGGRGVSFVFDIDELGDAINKARNASLSKKVLMQKHIQGTEHGFTAIVKKSEVVFSFFDDEYRNLNRYRVAGTISPSSVSSASKDFLITWLNTFSKFHNLRDGLIHLQFLEQDTGPIVLEICRRPPGDFYPDFVESACNYSYTRNVLNGYFGLPIEDSNLNNETSFTTFRHVVTATKNGLYKGLEISNEMRSTKDFSLIEFKKIGDVVSDFLNETIGIAIFKVNSSEKIEFLAKINSHFKALVES